MEGTSKVEQMATRTRQNKIRIIYLLGHSRSGSTILSLHLGNKEGIFHAGEIKHFNRSYKDRNCICGETAEGCPTWGPFIRKEIEYFEKEIMRNDPLSLLRLIFKSMFIGYKHTEISRERDFLASLVELSQNSFILDSSKSLHRLIMLRKLEDIELHTIYLERNLRSNIASLVKRGESLMSSFLRVKVNRLLIRRYLRRHQVNYHRVTFEDFLTQPSKVMTDILEYLGLEDSATVFRWEGIHLITGNTRTREKILKRSIEIDPTVNEEEPFTKVQLRLLKILGC